MRIVTNNDRGKSVMGLFNRISKCLQVSLQLKSHVVVILGLGMQDDKHAKISTVKVFAYKPISEIFEVH